MEGAKLLRGPEDALELLYASGSPRPSARSTPATLEPRLLSILERVVSGADSPDRLTRGEADACEILLALSELELMGLLSRGDGGRYVPSQH